MVKSALIVIDVQNYFINHNTSSLPKKIAQFIKKNGFDFVLFTIFINKRNSNFFSKLNWKRCIHSPDIDIHPALAQLTNDNNVFKKSTYSIFKSKNLIKFLKKNKITKLFLCGVDVDACILASAYEGFDLGYEVTILENLSFSHSGKRLQNFAFAIIKKNLQR